MPSKGSGIGREIRNDIKNDNENMNKILNQFLSDSTTTTGGGVNTQGVKKATKNLEDFAKAVGYTADQINKLNKEEKDLLATEYNKGKSGKNRFFLTDIDQASQALKELYKMMQNPPKGTKAEQHESNIYQLIRAAQAQFGEGAVDFKGEFKQYEEIFKKYHVNEGAKAQRSSRGIYDQYEDLGELSKYYKGIGEALKSDIADSLKGIGSVIKNALSDISRQSAGINTQILDADDIISKNTEQEIEKKMKRLRDRLNEMAKQIGNAKKINKKEADEFVRGYSEYNEYYASDAKYQKTALPTDIKKLYTSLGTGSVKVADDDKWSRDESIAEGKKTARDVLEGRVSAEEVKSMEKASKQSTEARIRAYLEEKKLSGDVVKALDAYMQARAKELEKAKQAMDMQAEYDKAMDIYEALSKSRNYRKATQLVEGVVNGARDPFSRANVPESQMLGAITNTNIKKKSDIEIARQRLNPEAWEREQEVTRRQTEWDRATKKFQDIPRMPKELTAGFNELTEQIETTDKSLEDLLNDLKELAKSYGFVQDKKGNWGQFTAQQTSAKEETQRVRDLRARQEALIAERDRKKAEFKQSISGEGGKLDLGRAYYIAGDESIRTIAEGSDDLKNISEAINEYINQYKGLQGKVKVLNKDGEEVTKDIYEFVKIFNSNKFVKGTALEIKSPILEKDEEITELDKQIKSIKDEISREMANTDTASPEWQAQAKKAGDDFAEAWTKGLTGNAKKSAEKVARQYFAELKSALENGDYIDIFNDFNGYNEIDRAWAMENGQDPKTALSRRRTLLSNLTTGQSITSGKAAQSALQTMNPEAFQEAQEADLIDQQLEKFKGFINLRKKGITQAIQGIINNLTEQVESGEMSAENAIAELEKQAKGGKIKMVFDVALGWIDPVKNAQKRLEAELDKLDEGGDFGSGYILEEAMKKINIDTSKDDINAIIEDSVQQLQESIKIYWDSFVNALKIDSPNKLLVEGDKINTSNLKGKATLMRDFSTEDKTPDELVAEINNALDAEKPEPLDEKQYEGIARRYVKFINQQIEDRLAEAEAELEQKAEELEKETTSELGKEPEPEEPKPEPKKKSGGKKKQTDKSETTSSTEGEKQASEGLTAAEKEEGKVSEDLAKKKKQETEARRDNASAMEAEKKASQGQSSAPATQQPQGGGTQDYKKERKDIFNYINTNSPQSKFGLNPKRVQYFNNDANIDVVRKFGEVVQGVDTASIDTVVNVFTNIALSAINATDAIEKLEQAYASLPKKPVPTETPAEPEPTTPPPTSQEPATPPTTSEKEGEEKVAEATEKATTAKKKKKKTTEEGKKATEEETQATREATEATKEETAALEKRNEESEKDIKLRQEYAEKAKKFTRQKDLNSEIAVLERDRVQTESRREQFLQGIDIINKYGTDKSAEDWLALTTEKLKGHNVGKAQAYYKQYQAMGGTVGPLGFGSINDEASKKLLSEASVTFFDSYLHDLSIQIEEYNKRLTAMIRKGYRKQANEAEKAQQQEIQQLPATVNNTLQPPAPADSSSSSGGVMGAVGNTINKILTSVTWNNWGRDFNASIASKDNAKFKKYAEKIILAYNYFAEIGQNVTTYKNLYDKAVKEFLKVEPDVASLDFIKQKLLTDTGETLEQGFQRTSSRGRERKDALHLLGFDLNGTMEQRQLPGPATPPTSKKTAPRQRPAESAPTPTQAPTPAITATGVGTALKEEQSVVDSVIEAEKTKIGELETELNKEVPAAIEAKNQKFLAEETLVRGVVDNENRYLSQLERKLDEGIPQSIAKKNLAFTQSAQHTEEVINAEAGKIDAFRQSIEDLGKLRTEQNVEIISETPVDERIAQLKEAFAKFSELKTIFEQNEYPFQTLPDDAYFKRITDILSSFNLSDLYNLDYDMVTHKDLESFVELIERMKKEIPELQEQLRSLPDEETKETKDQFIDLDDKIVEGVNNVLLCTTELIECYDKFTDKINQSKEAIKGTSKVTQEMRDEYNKFLLLFQETGDANVFKDRLNSAFKVPQLRELSGMEGLPKWQDKDGNPINRPELLKNLTRKAIDTYHPEVVENPDGTYGNLQSIAEKAKAAYEELQKKITETKEALVALDQKVDEAADVSAIKREIEVLNELITVMTEKIPPAVDKKNREFIESTSFIGKEVYERISQLEDVVNRLYTIADNLNFSIVGIDNLNDLDDALDAVKIAFEQTDFKDFNAALATTIEILKGIFEYKIPDDNILDRIDKMLGKSDELDNLATILSESKKKIDEAFEKLKVQPPDMLGTMTDIFTPDSNGWNDLLQIIEAVGIKAGDVAKIVRNVRVDNNGQSYESFNVQTTKGHVKTVAKDSNGALSIRDDVTNKFSTLVKDYEKAIKEFEQVGKKKDNDAIQNARNVVLQAKKDLEDYVNTYKIGEEKLGELNIKYQNDEGKVRTQENTNTYDSYIKDLQAVIDANTELNNITVLNTKANGAFDESVQRANDALVDIKARAEDAWKALKKLRSQGVISPEQFKKAKDIRTSQEYDDGSLSSQLAYRRAFDAKDLKDSKDAYDDLISVTKKYINVVKNIGTKKELQGDKQAMVDLFNEIMRINQAIEDNGLFNDSFNKLFEQLMDGLNEYIERTESVEKANKFIENQKKAYQELSQAVAEYVEQRKRFATGKALPTDDYTQAMQNVRNQVSNLGVYRDDEMLKNALSPVKDMEKDLKTIDAVNKQTRDYALLTQAVNKYVEAMKRIQGRKALQGDEQAVIDLKKQIDELSDKILHSPWYDKTMQDKALAPMKEIDEQLQIIQQRVDKSDTKNLEALWNRADKAVETYLKSAEKVLEIQRQIDSGERSALGVSDEMRSAINKMNANKAKADEAMSKYTQRANPALFVPDNEGAVNANLGQADSTQATYGNVNTKSSIWGFETLEKSFRTLTAEADKFYAILYKQDTNKSLSYKELQYLNQLKPLYEDVKVNAQAYQEQLEQSGNADLFDNLSDAMAQGKTKAILEDVNALGKAIENAGNKANTTKAFQQWVFDAEKEYEKLREEVMNFKWTGNAEQDLKNIETRIKDLKKETVSKTSSRFSAVVQKRDVSSLDRQMAEWQSKNKRAVGASEEIDKLREKLQGVESDGALQSIKRRFEDIKKEAINAGQVGRTFAEKLKGSFANLSRYLLSFASFYRIIASIKSAISTVTELDKSLNELRKVSELTKEELREFEIQSFDLAERVGTTSNQIIQSTADWKRLGGLRFIYLPPFYTAMCRMQTT